MRHFKGTTGFRDEDKDKIDFEGAISPLVLKAYGEYMHRHRKVKGGLRDSDNWQKGFGKNHRDVCMKSLTRHFMDLWLAHRGEKSREGIEDAICGVLFNSMAYYHDILKVLKKGIVD